MKKILLITAAALTLGSCKSYLDIKPYGRTIPKTADEFSSLLNSTLEKIDNGEEIIVGDLSSAIEFECYTDNLEANLTRYPDGNLLALYIGTHLSNKQQDYSNLYNVIRDCNIVIGDLKERDTRLGKDVLGTAYALRGVCYYQLLRQFCQPYNANAPKLLGVPLVTTFDMEYRPIRSSYEQTAAQIISDLEQALEYDIQDEIYRFNNDVVMGYLARACFWCQRYDDAILYAGKVLDNHPLLSGDAYKEMISSQVQRKGNTLLKSQTILTASQATSLEGFKRYLLARPFSRQFIDLFAEKERDVRYNLTIAPKRESKKNAFGSLRSAEMCLILAESHYHQGDSDEALRYLNLLRSHRIEGVVDYTLTNLPPVNADDKVQVDAKGNALTPLLYAIFCERRKEFYLENGDRWFELKRNGCPEMWVSQNGLKYITEKFMYTFPINITDVLLTPELIQNPGYENTK